VAAIEIRRGAAKVIDLVVGFANLTQLGVSLEQEVDFLALVLVRVRGLFAGRRR
jgi:hypothetical protein